MATSNYIASGWTASSGAYDQDGLLSGSVPSRDIFNGELTVGVYQIRYESAQYPVFCSCDDLKNIGIPQDSDEAWLVYPGYGIKLFSQTNWSGTASNTYYNTTNQPVFFITNPNWGTGSGTIVYEEGSTSDRFGFNNTQSVKVYFRGDRSNGNEYEVTIGGLTS
jgi:hypothetical protein